MDINNPNKVVTFGLEQSEFRMPGFKDSRLIQNDSYKLRGTLRRDSLYSRSLKNNRPIYIYEPPGMKPEQRYPVILFKDGAMYVERLKVPQILDSLIAAKLIPPMIGLFANPVNRRTEYVSNAAYRNFIEEELLPFFEKKYHASEYAAVGSSRGGLATADLVMFHPDIFRKCIGINPAFRPADLVDQWIKLRPALQKVIIVESRYDADWVPDARLWRQALQTLQIPHVYWEIPQGHNQEAWGGVMDEALIELFK